MTNPYALIFQAPGAKGLAAAAFVARFPIAMAPIGIVTMLSQIRGGYWLAGAVAATYTLANALAAPQISRLVDRFGQFRLLIPTTAASVIGFTLLMISAHRAWPVWSLFAAALLAAAMPSISAMVRARWTALIRDRSELATAFAFESTADELIYIGGASLSVGLAVALFPEAGVLASTMILAAGTAAFVAQRGTEPRSHRPGQDRAGSAILLRPVQLITLTMVCVGAIFATAEITVVALTRELDRPGAATGIIGVYAAGSFVVGVVMGAIKLTIKPHRQLLFAVGTLLLTTIPLLFADTVLFLALTILLSGVSVSPTFITAFSLVERRVPPSALTEGITWVGTGIGIGMALGAFVSGAVIDVFGAGSGFAVSLSAAVLAFATVALGQRTLAGATLPPTATGVDPVRTR